MVSHPLIIAGMHRSGTSLTAGLIQQLGVDVGARLVAADRHNAKGYFEDIEFLSFQRKVLQACCDATDPGWHDWGWTEQETLDPQKFARYRSEALHLLESRRNWPTLWGWKDPRTSLMLDFWHDLLPEARYILVYRYPWDVADSILRLQAPVFQQNPQYIGKIWQYYNRHLLDFYQRHADRAVLFSVNALNKLLEFVACLQTKLHLPLEITADQVHTLLTQTFSQDLFHQLDFGHPFVSAHWQSDRESAKLLECLILQSDIAPPPFLPAPSLPLTAEVLQLHALAQPNQALQQQLAIALAEIETMQRSKFWKLRNWWWSWKTMQIP